MTSNKIIRLTTIPVSLKVLLEGQLHFIAENGFEVVGISSSGTQLKEVEKNEEIRTIIIEMTRSISPVKDLKTLWRLYKVFKEEKPLIVHTHTPKAGTLGMIAAKLAGIPHRLHTVAGLPLLVAKGKKRKLLDIVEKLTYLCATKIYPNSLGLKSIILKNKYTTENKVKVIGKGSSNGVDTSYFTSNLVSAEEKKLLKELLKIELDDFVYLFVGRIVKDKGINELVKSFDTINKKFPKTKLLLVGNFERQLDPLNSKIEHIIDTNPNILAVGYQKDVRPYFAIADVFTFPSYREGFPNVLMQSCAMGIASIATDINGCNEIIEDGINGIIIPPQNQEKLYEKMLYLYQNPEIRKQIASNSRQKIVDNYERKYVWGEILKEYNSLINSR